MSVTVGEPSISASPEAVAVRGGLRHGAISVMSIVLGVAAVISVAMHAHVFAGVFVCVFLLIGVGSTPLVLFPRAGAAQLDLVVAGLAGGVFGLPVAGGFLMIELHVWVPDLLALAVALVVCGIHVRHLRMVAVSGLRRGLRSDIAAIRGVVTVDTGLSVAGLAICVISGLLQYPLTPGKLGMMSTLTWVWYVGFAMCGVAVADLLRRSRQPGFKPGVAAVPCVILVGLISLTTAIVYSEPRFEWVGQHIGVIEYLLHVHRAKVGSNLYQAFPGLFAGCAWIVHVGHIGDPMTLAKWFPAIADITTALGVALIARRLLSSAAVGWTAAVLFGLSLSFGQDYLSPQAIGLAWATAIFGLAIGRSAVPRAFELGLVLFLGLCIAVTHQLTPYPVFGALFLLTLFKLVRPWWVSLTVLVPAVVWEAFHYSTWKGYLSKGTFDIFGNATTLHSFSGESYGQARIVHVASYTLGAGIVLVGVFAVLEVVRHRDRLHLAIALCAVSPVMLLAATSYGGETDNRVVFFAMPWVATLAANWWHTSRARDWMLGALALVLSATSYVAVTGMDWEFIESPASLAAERFAEHHAGPRTEIVVAGDTNGIPIDVTKNYPSLTIPGLDKYEKIAVVQRRYGSAGYVARLPKLIKSRTADPGVEVIATPSMARFDDQKGIQTIAQYDGFVAAMNRSPRWKVVFSRDGAMVWRLKSGA